MLMSKRIAHGRSRFSPREIGERVHARGVRAPHLATGSGPGSTMGALRVLFRLATLAGVAAVLAHALAVRFPAYASFGRCALRLMTASGGGVANWADICGDGREERCLEHVRASAPEGDARAVLAAIDAFGREIDMLINIGDVKGKILSDALNARRPARALELGAYVGYSAIRAGVALREWNGTLTSVEISEENAVIARAMVAHAGLSSTVSIVVGTVAGGALDGAAPFDFVLLDHDKYFYLSDQQRLLRAGLLSPSAVVVADNCGVPGAPEYVAYMRGEGRALWDTVEHETSLEYLDAIPDRVLVSTLK